MFSLEEKFFVLLGIWGWLVGMDVGQGFSLILSCIGLELEEWLKFWGGRCQFFTYSNGNLKIFGRPSLSCSCRVIVRLQLYFTLGWADVFVTAYVEPTKPT